MGTWGTTIFSDDTAADVRDLFTDFIAEGLSVSEATNRLLAELKDVLDDEDDALVFWLALAATQSKLGRLTDEIRDRAVGIIDSGKALCRWEEDASKAKVANRKKHLERLREQLLGPQPEPKRLRPRKKSSTDFLPGDVATYRLDEKTSVRFCVLQLSGDLGGTYADICLLGLEDGKPFTKASLALTDTLGPHFMMLLHEPEDRITILRSGVLVPEYDNRENRRAWFQIPVDGYACRWKDFDDALRDVLPQLGWM